MVYGAWLGACTCYSVRNGCCPPEGALSLVSVHRCSSWGAICTRAEVEEARDGARCSVGDSSHQGWLFTRRGLASPLGTGLGGPSPADTHLFVSLQSRDKGPVVEQELQTFLGVIVTQLLEGGRPVLALVPRILKAWSVDHHDGSHRQMVGGEGSGERRERF